MLDLPIVKDLELTDEQKLKLEMSKEEFFEKDVARGCVNQ